MKKVFLHCMVLILFSGAVAQAESFSTYRSRADGYSIAYPSHWTTSRQGDSVSFDAPQVGGISVRVDRFPGNKQSPVSTIDQVPGIMEKLKAQVTESMHGTIIQSGKTKLAGRPAI